MNWENFTSSNILLIFFCKKKYFYFIINLFSDHFICTTIFLIINIQNLNIICKFFYFYFYY